MSRQRPQQLHRGSRRWYAKTMRAWAVQIGMDVPKSRRRSMRGAAQRGLYDRPWWAYARQDYESW